MDTATFTQAADALIARNRPMTAENLRAVVEEINQADQGLAPEPPSLPGREFRTRVHAFALEEGATDNHWQAYRDALQAEGYEIRWAGEDPTTRCHDDGTGHSAAERGPYVILDHTQPQTPTEQPQPSGIRGLLDRARNALQRAPETTEQERRRAAFRHRHLAEMKNESELARGSCSGLDDPGTDLTL